MAGNKQHFWIDRRHPRISTALSCQVSVPHDKMHPALMHNLSPGGLKFSCAHDTFIALVPESQRTPGLVQDVRIEIQFQLTSSGGKEPSTIRAEADIIHTERLAQDCYHIGAQFLQLQDDAVQAIESYVTEMTKP
jgi:PilZ domain